MKKKQLNCVVIKIPICRETTDRYNFCAGFERKYKGKNGEDLNENFTTKGKKMGQSKQKIILIGPLN